MVYGETMTRTDKIYNMFRAGIPLWGIAQRFNMSESRVMHVLIDARPKEYCINILDPDTREVIIHSIDRNMAMSKEESVKTFKDYANWRSNWLVDAVPVKYKIA